MRQRIIYYLKSHPLFVKIFWTVAKYVLYAWGLFVPVQNKTMIFCSFGGRKFDDSPKALYDAICKKEEFKEWRLIWAFVDPDAYELPRGEKVKIDTLAFFHTLLSSRVWVSNSGMDRGIELHRKRNIIVETWHGTPLKKIGGEENQNSFGGGSTPKGAPDKHTIRCAQSEYDQEIFARIFNASKEAILLSDLPRNDVLTRCNAEKISLTREKLGISETKKIILYTPTYREYLVDENKETFLAPPIDLKKWRNKLSEQYVLLIRAHYAVAKALNIPDDPFVIDVSSYPDLNELYMVSDLMISDYSSTFFDYSILDRPMLCFAYDLEEYEEKRGLYLNLKEALPCRVDMSEDEVLESICMLDYEKACEDTKAFHQKYARFAGNSCDIVINEIVSKMR